MELAAAENTLLAFDPISRIVPTTRTRITAYFGNILPLLLFPKLEYCCHYTAPPDTMRHFYSNDSTTELRNAHSYISHWLDRG